MLTITRKFEFDAGHRIAHHNSQCRNLHGHRFTLYVTLEGEVITKEGASNEGMILDFSEFKALTKEHLISHWDHAFFVHEKDTVLRQFLDSLPNHKTVVLDLVPTVENMAKIAFDILKNIYQKTYGDAFTLHSVKLYETPNCFAEITAQNK